jgi:TPR repeat protein
VNEKTSSAPQPAQLPETPEIRHRLALDAYQHGDYPEALRRARALIDEGFNHANALAGVLYEAGGRGIDQNFENALFYYQRATETVGSVEGWLGLARMYFFGKGVPKDTLRAAEYYQIVDEDTNSPTAQLMLGRIFSDAQSPLYDLQKARSYLRRAASNGSVYANAYWALLERSQGNLWLSFWLRLKAAALAFSISKRDRTDPRLRQS